MSGSRYWTLRVHDDHVEHALQAAHDGLVEVGADSVGGARPDRRQKSVDVEPVGVHEVATDALLVPDGLHADVQRGRHELADEGCHLAVTRVEVDEADRQRPARVSRRSGDRAGQQDRRGRLARAALAGGHGDGDLAGQLGPLQQLQRRGGRVLAVDRGRRGGGAADGRKRRPVPGGTARDADGRSRGSGRRGHEGGWLGDGLDLPDLLDLIGSRRSPRPGREPARARTGRPWAGRRRQPRPPRCRRRGRCRPQPGTRPGRTPPARAPCA